MRCQPSRSGAPIEVMVPERTADGGAQVIQASVGRKIFSADGDRGEASAAGGYWLKATGVGDFVDRHRQRIAPRGGLLFEAGRPACGLFAPGGPHGRRGNSIQREHLKIVLLREIHELVLREASAGPLVKRLASCGAVELQARQSAGPQHAMNLAQEGDHQLLAGDVREQIKRVHEIEGLIREILQAGPANLLRARVWTDPADFRALPG